jgi:hypothetical protein
MQFPVQLFYKYLSTQIVKPAARGYPSIHHGDGRGRRCCEDRVWHGGRAEGLKNLYHRQLRQAAKFVRYFEMRDRDNRVVYLRAEYHGRHSSNRL